MSDKVRSDRIPPDVCNKVNHGKMTHFPAISRLQSKPQLIFLRDRISERTTRERARRLEGGNKETACSLCKFRRNFDIT